MTAPGYPRAKGLIHIEEDIQSTWLGARKVRPPGVEPGSQAWEAEVIPLDHDCPWAPEGQKPHTYRARTRERRGENGERVRVQTGRGQKLTVKKEAKKVATRTLKHELWEKNMSHARVRRPHTPSRTSRANGWEHQKCPRRELNPGHKHGRLAL